MTGRRRARHPPPPFLGVRGLGGVVDTNVAAYDEPVADRVGTMVVALRTTKMFRAARAVRPRCP